jgi:tetratricopeptide (TPR) repeat protein
VRLPSILQRLEQAGLLLRGSEGDYLFAHSLIQEAAYASLLKRERRRIHRAAGEAMEKDPGASLPDAAPILASHFEEAGDDERSLRYRTLAGDAALRVFALPEAIDHYSRALALARRLPGVSGVRVLLHLYSSRGHAFELASRHTEALRNYEEMEEADLAGRDPHLALEGRMARASILAGSSSHRDPARAERLCREGLDLAHALNDPAAEAKVLWILTNLYGFSGRQSEAVAHGERSLALARDFGLREQEAFTLTDVARAYGSLGRYPEAWSSLAQAQGLWREQGNLPMLADTLASSVLNDYLRGELSRAVASAEEAQRITLEIGNLWGQAFSRMFVGSAYRDLGEIAQALRSWTECLEMCEPAGFPGPLIYSRTDLALLYTDLGMIPEASALLGEAIKAAEKHFPKYLPVPVLALARLQGLGGNHRLAAEGLEQVREVLQESDPAVGLLTSRLPGVEVELALLRGDAAGAIRVSREADALRSRGIRVPIPHLLLLRGQAFIELGKLAPAREALDEARREAEAQGSRWVLWRVLYTSGKAARRDGDAAAGERLWSEAREVAEYVGAKMGDGRLREAFHSGADVRELFGAP